MLSFEYTAKDPNTGNLLKADIQAESEQAAAKLLVKQGLAPLEIHLKGANKGFMRTFKDRIRTKDSP